VLRCNIINPYRAGQTMSIRNSMSWGYSLCFGAANTHFSIVTFHLELIPDVRQTAKLGPPRCLCLPTRAEEMTRCRVE